jgi:hypothetical protein
VLTIKALHPPSEDARTAQEAFSTGRGRFDPKAVPSASCASRFGSSPDIPGQEGTP